MFLLYETGKSYGGERLSILPKVEEGIEQLRAELEGENSSHSRPINNYLNTEGILLCNRTLDPLVNHLDNDELDLLPKGFEVTSAFFQFELAKRMGRMCVLSEREHADINGYHGGVPVSLTLLSDDHPARKSVDS